jgi:flagellar protein FlaG
MELNLVSPDHQLAAPSLPAPAGQLRANGTDQQDPQAKRRLLLDAMVGSQPQTSMRQVDVHFEVDESINRVLARIVDSVTGEVVREVPPEELVDLARRITALVGAQLDRQV